MWMTPHQEGHLGSTALGTTWMNTSRLRGETKPAKAYALLLTHVDMSVHLKITRIKRYGNIWAQKPATHRELGLVGGWVAWERRVNQHIYLSWGWSESDSNSLGSENYNLLGALAQAHRSINRLFLMYLFVNSFSKYLLNTRSYLVVYEALGIQWWANQNPCLHEFHTF